MPQSHGLNHLLQDAQDTANPTQEGSEEQPRHSEGPLQRRTGRWKVPGFPWEKELSTKKKKKQYDFEIVTLKYMKKEIMHLKKGQVETPREKIYKKVHSPYIQQIKIPGEF